MNKYLTKEEVLNGNLDEDTNLRKHILNIANILRDLKLPYCPNEPKTKLSNKAKITLYEIAKYKNGGYTFSGNREFIKVEERKKNYSCSIWFHYTVLCSKTAYRKRIEQLEHETNNALYGMDYKKKKLDYFKLFKKIEV
jgi:hypothetical protein